MRGLGAERVGDADCRAGTVMWELSALQGGMGAPLHSRLQLGLREAPQPGRRRPANPTRKTMTERCFVPHQSISCSLTCPHPDLLPSLRTPRGKMEEILLAFYGCDC